MALIPGDTDDSFIREVDEEYRRAQLKGWWARYGRWLIAGVLLFLAALGGLLWWRAEQARAAGVRGEEFSRALGKLETGNLPEAAPVLAKLADGGDGYATLSRLTQAGNAVTAGDTAKAISIYNAVAADAAQPQPFRDLATVKAVRLQFDGLPPQTVIDRLKGLSLPGNPWFGVAGEMTAAARLKLGQTQLAGALLAAIAADKTQPASLRGRSQQLAASLGVAVPGEL